MTRSRLLVARIAAALSLLLACVALKYSPGVLARPLFVFTIGALGFATACGLFGSERKRTFWVGFAILMSLYAVLGLFELFRVFGKSG